MNSWIGMGRVHNFHSVQGGKQNPSSDVPRTPKKNGPAINESGTARSQGSEEIKEIDDALRWWRPAESNGH